MVTTTPPITITFYDKRIMSVDNRRLKAHRDAGVRIRYVKKRHEDLNARELSHIDGQAPASNINVR